MTKITKWITLSSTIFLSILIIQNTLLAESNIEIQPSKETVIAQESTFLNSTQPNEFNQLEQPLIIAQNSGQNSQSNSQDWKTILGYIVGGVLLVLFILSQ